MILGAGRVMNLPLHRRELIADIGGAAVLWLITARAG
jgi:hypothetical protein